MADAKIVAKEILDVIGKNNIASYTNCMTRLRVETKTNNFDSTKLKTINGVLGLITSGQTQYQMVLGPGFVNKVAAEFGKIAELESLEPVDENLDEHLTSDGASLEEIAKEEKAKFRNKNEHGVMKSFLTKVSRVFSPLIPAFIGAGILSGLSGIIKAFYSGGTIPADATAAAS